MTIATPAPLPGPTILAESLARPPAPTGRREAGRRRPFRGATTILLAAVSLGAVLMAMPAGAIAGGGGGEGGGNYDAGHEAK